MKVKPGLLSMITLAPAGSFSGTVVPITGSNALNCLGEFCVAVKLRMRDGTSIGVL